MHYLNRFRRVTDSTHYLPEIDGLRCLALVLVVAILHIPHYIDLKYYNSQWIESAYWSNFIREGGFGVPVFFMISGFILSLPFARWRLANQKPVRLRNYYLRRLTRLEPPYLIVLVLLFVLQVWVLHMYSFHDLLPHLAASAVYLHTILYDSFSPVLPVSWSLEVEVQFYLIAPLFFQLFRWRNTVMRRALLIAIILVSAIYWFDVWGMPHLFMYLHFFAAGILMADLHAAGINLVPRRPLGTLTGLAALAGLLFVPSIPTLMGYLVRLACLCWFFHCLLNSAFWKRSFSWAPLVIIGGMCYSVYLLHFAVIAALGRAIERVPIELNNKIYFLPLLLVLLFAVLLVSAVYFLLVEKPFMRIRWS